MKSGCERLDAQRLFEGNGKRRISVINFSGQSPEDRNVLVKQLLVLACDYVAKHPNPTGRLLVFDEAQNFEPCKDLLNEYAAQMRNPVQRGHRFQCKADSIPVIADST
jgi:hypothetical protein